MRVVHSRLEEVWRQAKSEKLRMSKDIRNLSELRALRTKSSYPYRPRAQRRLAQRLASSPPRTLEPIALRPVDESDGLSRLSRRPQPNGWRSSAASRSTALVPIDPEPQPRIGEPVRLSEVDVIAHARPVARRGTGLPAFVVGLVAAFVTGAWLYAFLS